MPIFVSHNPVAAGGAVASDISGFQRDRVLNNEAQQQAAFQAQQQQQALQNALRMQEYADQQAQQQYSRDLNAQNFEMQKQKYLDDVARQQAQDAYNRQINERDFGFNQQKYQEQLAQQQRAQEEQARLRWAQLQQKDQATEGNLGARYAAMEAANQRAMLGQQGQNERAQGGWENRQQLAEFNQGQQNQRTQFIQGQQNYRTQGGWGNQQQMQEQRLGFQGEQNDLDRQLDQNRLKFQAIQADAQAGRFSQNQAQQAYLAWTRSQTQLLAAKLSSLTTLMGRVQQAYQDARQQGATPEYLAQIEKQAQALERERLATLDQISALQGAMGGSPLQQAPPPTTQAATQPSYGGVPAPQPVMRNPLDTQGYDGIPYQTRLTGGVPTTQPSAPPPIVGPDGMLWVQRIDPQGNEVWVNTGQYANLVKA